MCGSEGKYILSLRVGTFSASGMVRSQPQGWYVLSLRVGTFSASGMVRSQPQGWYVLSPRDGMFSAPCRDGKCVLSPRDGTVGTYVLCPRDEHGCTQPQG